MKKILPDQIVIFWRKGKGNCNFRHEVLKVIEDCDQGIFRALKVEVFINIYTVLRPSTTINNTWHKDALRLHKSSQNAIEPDVTWKQHRYRYNTRLCMHNAVNITANPGTHYQWTSLQSQSDTSSYTA